MNTRSALADLDLDNLYSTEELEKGFGFSRKALRRLVENGALHNPARGIYIRDGYEEHVLDREIVIAKRCPHVVFSLNTAAQLHGLTLRNKDSISIGLPYDQPTAPRIGGDFTTPLDVIRWSKPEDSTAGIEIVSLRGVDLKFTDRARTVFDMWRYSYRNPSLRGTAPRVSDEDLQLAVGTFLQSTKGASAPLQPIMDKLQISDRMRNAYTDYLRSFAGGYGASMSF